MHYMAARTAGTLPPLLQRAPTQRPAVLDAVRHQCAATEGCDLRGSSRSGGPGLCKWHTAVAYRARIKAAGGFCCIDGCDRVLRSATNGWCGWHYRHWLRYGHPVDEAEALLPSRPFTYALTCAGCGMAWTYARSSQFGRLPLRCDACRAESIRVRARSSGALPAVKERKKQWAEAHRDRRRASQKAWKVANPERVRADGRARKKRNPELNRSYNQARNAKKRGLTVVPFAKAQLLARLALYAGRCWMCGAAADVIDHVKPLAAGGAHMLCNLRPACTWCNSRKNDQWPWTAADVRALVALR